MNLVREPARPQAGEPALSPTRAPHALGIDAVLADLGTGPHGLSGAEALARRGRFGPNALPRARPPNVLRIFARQFLSPLIYILLAAAAVSLLLRHLSDAAFILAVLLLNALIGAVQELRAHRSAQSLQELIVARARVVRDGEDQEIDAAELVPGDVVLLESGGRVPADLRLLREAGLEVDESLLTGESMAVAKQAPDPAPPDASLGDRTNMAFAGSLVARGRGSGVVVATGLRTELGRIASSVLGAGLARPPLLVRMERFTRRIAAAIGAAVVLLGALSLARGATLDEVFLTAVALAVSAIPEGLPVALTVALSIGARRMGARRVIARRLVAVESLGSCTYVASDKTGTLTLNELSVRRVLLPGQPAAWEVTGRGPEGAVEAPPGADLAGGRALLERLCTAAALCNDGFLGRRDGDWVEHGDAVDVALLGLAAKIGLWRSALESSCPRVGAIPFESERGFAATLDRCGDRDLAHVKGAAERVLPMCASVADPLHGERPLDPEAMEAAAAALAAQGYRVLALAAGEPVRPQGADLAAEHLRGLVFLGFVGLIDPLRPEAKAAIEGCHRAGLEVAMVTGDHPLTALAIARELGLAGPQEPAVTGRELREAAARGPAALDEAVRRTRVFARVEPTQKLDIVRSLQRQGHFVAVTGDGANDAPALHAAHIGVAMGRRGTDLARESAELILADDNFASIVAGIEEGRVAYANVRKVIFLLISTGAAALLLFLAVIAAGLPLPLLPAQLLWLNLVANGIQDVALAFEPREGDELARPPRSPREPIFDRVMLERTLLSAVVMAGVGFGFFQWALAQGWPLAEARSGLLLLLVLFGNVQAGNSRSESRSLLRLNPLRNPLLLFGALIAQLVHIGAMYVPGVRDVLGLQPVSLVQWLLSLGLALSLFLAMELYKLRPRPPASPRPAPSAAG